MLRRAAPLRALLSALLLVAPLFATGLAQAQEGRVALLPIEAGPGQGARRIEGRAQEALESLGYQVVSPNDIRELGAETDDISSLATQLGAQAVVGGRIRGRGNRRRLELWVKDASGRERGETSARVRGREPSAGRLARALRSALEASVEASVASSVAAGGPGPAVAPSGERSTPARAAAREDGGEDEEGPAREERRERGGEGARPEPILSLRAWAGGGIRTREATVLTADGSGATYRAGPYADLGLRLEASLFSYLILRGAFGSSVGLMSEDRLGGGESEATFLRAFGDIGGAFWLEEVSQIGLSFGVGWDRYQLPLNDLIPAAEYLFLRPALFTSVKIYRELLLLTGEMGVRIPLTVGELESVYGVDREVLGVDVAVRVGGSFDFGLTYTVEWSFRQYWLTFAQPAGPAELSDSGHRLSLLLGYQLSI